MNRFERQVILPGFGWESQKKLQKSSILVIGSGGLGCPALLYLAAAGIGKIGIVDGDIVSVSNLNRQILFGESDLGKSKAERAGELLRQKYDDLEVEVFNEFITTSNALEILSQYELILDGTDNFETRYLVNDAAFLLQKPLIFGAIYANEGQILVFNSSKKGGTNYRDLYPDPPSALEIPNCNQTGVLGVLPGMIGIMMATEAIKFLTGYAPTLENKILFFNGLTYQTYTVDFAPNSESRQEIPDSFDAFQAKDYSLSCLVATSVDWSFALHELEKGGVLVDIREASETPKLERDGVILLPLSQLSINSNFLSEWDMIFLFCQSGIRSLKAVDKLQKILPGKTIYSIKGGITTFKSTQ
jgi:molybdopterin/thiamine biosynthesis adenylyltransferase/rhodanese-related sulfurtransferase